jgi:hypothetical protein
LFFSSNSTINRDISLSDDTAGAFASNNFGKSRIKAKTVAKLIMAVKNLVFSPALLT